MPFIRSISGIRATQGDGLIPSELSKYIAAFCNIMPKGNIAIGYDGRETGKWIADLIVGTCKAMNRNVDMLGMVTTPTVQLVVEHKKDYSGGIQITASHNPGQWNGLKFIRYDGVFIDGAENQSMWDLIDNNKIDYPNNYEGKKLEFFKNADDFHINTILDSSLFTNPENLKEIRKKKFSAVVDAVNASGSIIVPKILKKFGVKSHNLFCEGDGNFPHTPEPIPENLGELANEVKKVKSDIGIAVDPDGDRLVLVDENGRLIGEEKTLALCTKYILGNKKDIPGENAIVLNLSTSMMSEMIANEYGAATYYAKVGEINVVKKMKEVNACFGGEGSGGIILPNVHYGRDSLVGIAIIMLLMAKENKPLSQLADELPQLTIVKTKKEFSGDFNSLLNIFEREFSEDAEVDKQDGLKFKYENSWLQIRSSNTEPIIRIMAEANNKEEADKLIEKAKTLI